MCNLMSKYDKLWKYVDKNCVDDLTLSFTDIEKIVGIKLDHSFLNNKKELFEYGCAVKKISMKQETVLFVREKK